MPTRPDLRDLTTGVRDAFAHADRETLLDVLAFVVKEYVVDGPPPMLIHQVETISDLAPLTFAQLVATLQTRFDHAELSLFAVDGENVSVRVGGVMQPLLRPVAQSSGAVAPAVASPVTADLPRPSAGVRVIEATMRQAPGAPVPPSAGGPVPGQYGQAQPGSAPPRSAPPPSAGISVRGQPRSDAAGGPGPTTPAAPPAAPVIAKDGAAGDDKPTSSGDDASARYSLLELD
jgi:hypothetical protein